MKNKYKIIISKLAEDDLLEILEYYNNGNVDLCKKTYFAIEDKISKLKEYPFQGRTVPELEKQNITDYRELIEGNYRIIYSLQEETILTNTILDSRRNIEELIIKKLMRNY